jgi:hypothetical protein
MTGQTAAAAANTKTGWSSLRRQKVRRAILVKGQSKLNPIAKINTQASYRIAAAHVTARPLNTSSPT